MLDIIIACDRRDVDLAFWLSNAPLLFQSTPIQSLILSQSNTVYRLKRNFINKVGFSIDEHQVHPPLLGHDKPSSKVGKAALLLTGFRFSTEPFLFFLDSDIRLPFSLLASFISKALTTPLSAFYLGAVYEISGFSPSRIFKGLMPSLQNRNYGVGHIEIIRWQSLGNRPGFGNIFVPRQCYLAAGKHDPGYIHYGWEDHDLIISLLLNNITVSPLGFAFHRTHGDDSRLLQTASRSNDVSNSFEYFCKKYGSLLRSSAEI